MELNDLLPQDSYNASKIIADSFDAADDNVLRRHIKKDPRKIEMARHRLWMEAVQHEYPMPYTRYRIGVYIRYYNQTKYDNYLDKHKMQFRDDISLCPAWSLEGFYIDHGLTAPRMENSSEWCRLLTDCFSGKVNLIVTQKVSNVSSNPDEITFIAGILAGQKPPVGIYFISEDIFTLASYYRNDLIAHSPLPEDWHILPKDSLDIPIGMDTPSMLPDGQNGNSSDNSEQVSNREEL